MKTPVTLGIAWVILSIIIGIYLWQSPTEKMSQEMLPATVDQRDEIVERENPNIAETRLYVEGTAGDDVSEIKLDVNP